MTDIKVDGNFFIDVSKKTFQYSENGISKRLSLNKLVSCEVYADIEDKPVENYTETSYGTIPFFEDSAELGKLASDAGTVLMIFFEDEDGNPKYYSKKYGKDASEQYDIRLLINKLVDEQ